MKMINTKFIGRALCALFMITSFIASAQPADSRAIRVSLGFSTGIPTRDGFNVVYGGDVRAQKDFSRSVSGLLTLGYNEFQHDHQNNLADFGFVPFKLGTKVFPLEKLYLIAEVGTAIKQHKAQESSFLWSPGLGWAFNNGLDLGLRYEESRRRGVGTGQFALRVAYGINLTSLIQRN
jgi:hypothetical protein